VVVNRARTPPKLLAYAVASFSLERIGADAVYDLYRPALPLDPAAPPVQPLRVLHARGVTTAVPIAAR
jgi:hypothetical protein